MSEALGAGVRGGRGGQSGFIKIGRRGARQVGVRGRRSGGYYIYGG